MDRAAFTGCVVADRNDVIPFFIQILRDILRSAGTDIDAQFVHNRDSPGMYTLRRCGSGGTDMQGIVKTAQKAFRHLAAA